MKLHVVLLFFVLTFSNIIIAQTKYGIKAGVNFSDQYKKVSPPAYSVGKQETKPLAGFQLGTFLKHKLNREFSLATELNFSAIGSKTKYLRTDLIINPDGTISGPTTGYYNDKIHEIEIPIFLQYNIKQFYLGLGPTIGIKISSKIDNYQNMSFNSTNYNLLDFGASSIIGYSVQKKIDLTLKYFYGLINTDKGNYPIVTKNRVVSFSVLYSL